MIYHYTTIETLDAILNSESIKFNKLTNMDDMAEFESFFGPFNPREYIFVSSWSKDPEENITLWNCYTDNKVGVRIGLEDMPFPLHFPADSRLKLTNNVTADNIPWLLVPFDDAFTKNYFIISFYYIKEDFEKEISYLSEKDLIKKYIKYRLKACDPVKKTVTTYAAELGAWKSKIWESQKEFRFVLNIFPQSDAYYSPESNTFTKDYIKGIFHNLNIKAKNSIEYYLLKMHKQAVDNMEIVLSPYAKEKDRNRTIDVMKRHGLPLSHLSKSKLRIQSKK